MQEILLVSQILAPPSILLCALNWYQIPLHVEYLTVIKEGGGCTGLVYCAHQLPRGFPGIFEF